MLEKGVFSAFSSKSSKKPILSEAISTITCEHIVENNMALLKTKHLSMFLIALFILSIFCVGQNAQITRTVAATSNSDIVLSNSESTSNYTNVILLGWDGVQRNHLYELLNAGMTPNLNAFIQTGKIVNITVSDHVTDTKSGWTQILTGYRWWKTGVYGNSVWFHTIPRGYTIPERLENIFGSNQIATAFITGKLNQMEIEDGTGTAAIGSSFANYSNDALYANLPSQLDVVSVGDLQQDRYADVAGPLMLKFLQEHANTHFFSFFHFSDPDHTGHMFGENSAEYSTAIETCDYWLGQILTSLNTLGLSQNTLIYITADHGFDEGSVWHSNAPYIFLATNDKNVIRDGDEVDIAPTVYYGLGLWNYSFSPALDGFPLQVNLDASEAQHRQAVLVDTSNIQWPSISIIDNGTDQKTVTFSASDNDLAAVFLVVDKVLKPDVQLTWTKAGTVTASGSCNINTTILNSGLHTVEVLAFDEHGSNNGFPGMNPANGVSPSSSSISFYSGIQPTPSPSPPLPQYPFASPSPSLTPEPLSTQTPTPSPSQTPSVEHSPTFSPSPTQTANIQTSPSPSPSPSSQFSSQPTSEPSPSSFPTTTVAALVIPVVIILIGILAYVRKRRTL